jgi:hypothetical protein
MTANHEVEVVTMLKMTLLRVALILDAAILLLLGASMIFMPGAMTEVFQMGAVPASTHYVIGLFGCALATLSWGYCVAAIDPVRHVAWIQLGILRGTVEVVVGLSYVLRGAVTWVQAGFGLGAATVVVVVYCLLYPRRPTKGAN